MLSQIWPDAAETEGGTLKGLEIFLENDFFEILQMFDVPHQAERKRIGNIIHQRKIELTYCLARFQNSLGLNLSSLDENKRRKSVEQLMPCLEHASQAGASRVMIISGPAPEGGALGREEALACFAESVTELCEVTQQESNLTLVVEPLDVHIHKKQTLGYTAEAVQLLESLKRFYDNVTLCLDTSHMMLNEENLATSLESALEYVDEIHLANCVTEAGHEFYGDHHIPFGAPGVLDVHDVGSIMMEGWRMEFFSRKRRPGVFCEVKTQPGEKPEDVIRHCREVIEKGWAIGQSLT